MAHRIKSYLRSVLPKRSVKVNAFILGAQKAGTSSLYSYLLMHPDIIGAKSKEVHFFSKPNNYARGTAWYHDQFDQLVYKPNKKVVYLDASPIYLYLREVPQRIYEYNPDAKMIILLRNPVERAYSQWNMFRNFNESTEHEKDKIIKTHSQGNIESDVKKFKELIYGKPFPTFREMVESDIENIRRDNFNKFGIVRRGLYLEQIQRYLTYFKKSQIFIIETEEFRNNCAGFTSQVADFLGVCKFDWDKLNYSEIHKRVYPLEAVDPEAFKKLGAFYKPYNEKLFKFLGKTYDW